MFLRGIAVYGINEDDSCELVRSSDSSADPTYARLFKPAKSEFLQLFEKSVLFKVHDRFEMDHAYHEQDNQCHFYAKKMVIKNDSGPVGDNRHTVFMIALISKNEMFQDAEFNRLMRNIQCVFIRQLQHKTQNQKTTVTLADIVAHPLEFTEKDMRQLEVKEQVENDPKIRAVKEELAKVKEVMLDNVDKLLGRGEALELLVAQTEQLDLAAVKFRDAAKAKNDEYSCMGRCIII